MTSLLAKGEVQGVSEGVKLSTENDKGWLETERSEGSMTGSREIRFRWMYGTRVENGCRRWTVPKGVWAGMLQRASAERSDRCMPLGSIGIGSQSVRSSEEAG